MDCIAIIFTIISAIVIFISIAYIIDPFIIGITLTIYKYLIKSSFRENKNIISSLIGGFYRVMKVSKNIIIKSITDKLKN